MAGIKRERSAYMRSYYEENKGKILARKSAYHAAHPEIKHAYQAAHKSEAAVARETYRLNPDGRATLASIQAQYRASKLQRTPVWANRGTIAAFYRLARAFTDLYIPHHVDHVLPLQGETVSGLHVEFNLQVIPATDNCSKSNRLLVPT